MAISVLCMVAVVALIVAYVAKLMHKEVKSDEGGSMKNPYVLPAIIIGVALFGAADMIHQPLRPDQYLTVDGQIYRFSGAVYGRVEVLNKSTGQWEMPRSGK